MDQEEKIQKALGTTRKWLLRLPITFVTKIIFDSEQTVEASSLEAAKKKLIDYYKKMPPKEITTMVIEQIHEAFEATDLRMFLFNAMEADDVVVTPDYTDIEDDEIPDDFDVLPDIE